MSMNAKPIRTLRELEFNKQAVQVLKTSGLPLAQVARELGTTQPS